MSSNVSLFKQAFDLSSLEGRKKSEIEKSDKKYLSNIFDAIDTNNDGTLSTSEVSIFKNVLKNADSDSDGDISKKEMRKFLKSGNEFVQRLIKNGKVKGSNISDFLSVLSNNNIQTAQTVSYDYSIQPNTKKDSYDATIDMIQDEVDNASEIFNSRENGLISKSYDDLKELYGSQLSSSAVAKNLFIKNETAELLRRAKAGTITYAEYYGISKENLMETFPNVEKMNEEQKQKLADMINSLSPKEVQQMQDLVLELPSPDSENYEQKLKEFQEIFLLTTTNQSQNTIHVEGDGWMNIESSENYETKSAYQLEKGNELISFEDMYKLRNGVEFDAVKVERYNKLKTEFAIQQSFNEIKNYAHGLLDDANSDSRIEKAVMEILNGLTQNKDDENLTRVLQNMTGITDISVANGKINANDMKAVKNALLDKIDIQVKEINGGKSFEHLNNEIETAYKEAFGSKNVEMLANAYVQEQEKFTQTARKVVEIGGGATAIVGMFCCPPLAIGAGLVGTFGGVGLEMLEESTKDNKSQEKLEALKKELALNAALFAAGMGSGIAGSAVGNVTKAFATKCPVLLGFVAERGVDATASLISTMALTGELDLKGVGMSQVLAVLTGLKSAKVGIANEAAQPDKLGINAFGVKNPGIFSKFFGTRDINPNSPLNKYKPSGTSYDLSHADFYKKNSHLFEGTHMYNCWSGKNSSDRKHGAWKMHLFSISEADWQKMADVIIPYLRDNDIDWKTFNVLNEADCLNGGAQQGKAFTIYPKDQKHFEQIARDLDYIIRNNNLNTTNTHIEGDRALGSSGRIFYRYEFKSGKYKDEILDLSSTEGNRLYDKLYDSNSDRIHRNGHGRYLADDMTSADDPFYNFDPANPASKPGVNNVGARNQADFDNYMQKECYYQVSSHSVLSLQDGAVIDFSDPYIQRKIASIPEGGSVTVGRDSGCYIRIHEDCVHVSRIHLVITKSGGRIYVKDVSSNGTKIIR